MSCILIQWERTDVSEGPTTSNYRVKVVYSEYEGSRFIWSSLSAEWLSGTFQPTGISFSCSLFGGQRNKRRSGNLLSSQNFVALAYSLKYV